MAILTVFWDRDADSDFVADFDVIFQLALQRTGSFEVVPVSRAQLYKLFHAYQFSSVSVLPDSLLPELKAQYAADPTVARAALDFSNRSTFNRYPVDSTGGILMSPRAFVGFAADTVFGTLPPR